MIYILLLLIILAEIEVTYSPRIEMTRTKDVLLMYTKNGFRDYKILFKLWF